MLKSLARLLLALAVFSGSAVAAGPLRVYLRSGPKTHGPGQHDHPRFAEEWTKLLTERGARVSGGEVWPTGEQFKALDVVVVFAPDPWDVTAETRADLDKYVEHGGGLVVLHDGICSHNDPAWVRGLIGGAWRYGTSKSFEGQISTYYVRNDDPIVLGASNFDVRDEMFYDLEMSPDAEVLAATWTPDARAQRNGRPFPSIYNVAPQMWSFDDDVHRAFVDLLGHNYGTLELPHVRAVLLRGIAWAGQRENVNELCSADELASLRYPPGGPSRPIESLAKLSLHPDFTAALVAAEPLVNKPIALDWDARGQLWVAETPEYPNGRHGIRPEFAGAEWKDHGALVPEAGKQLRPARDRLAILTDRDRDGIADHKEIFSEGLELVTGFVFHRDGVIVAAAPDIFWLRDTTGDGKADKSVKLYTGLGTRDSHAVINNLRWGFDGWIYATHGYSSSNRVTSGDGKKDFGHIGAGVVRFKPDGSAFEQYSSKSGNTWGLTVTEENELLWTQATSGDLLMETLLPESVLARGKVGETPSYKVILRSPKSFPMMTWEQQAYRQIDMVGSFTAAAGCAIYDGGTWPAKYRGSYFTTEPTINIVHQELLEPEGLSFAAHKESGRGSTEFLRSQDMWFRPIESRVGPDGALYVLDFYNQAVIHNDTRGPVHNGVNAAVRPDRDHYFGRIWRVDHQEAAVLPVPDLSKAGTAQLVAALESPNGPIRGTAHRLLVEQDARAMDVPLRTLALDGKRPASTRIHALWILHLAHRADGPLLLAAVRDAEPAVTRNALKIVAEDPALATAAAPAIAARLHDADPRTQLAALLALGAVEPYPYLCEQLVALVPELGDAYRQSAAIAAAARAPAEYLTAALTLPAAVLTDANVQEFLTQLSRQAEAQPESAARLVEQLARPETPAVAAATILRGLGEAGKSARRPAWTPELQAACAQLLATSALQSAAVPLVLDWDQEGALTPAITELIAKLEPQVEDAALPVAERDRLIDSLVAARKLSATILPTIARLLGCSDAPPDLQRHALAAIGETGDPAGGEALVTSYAKLHPLLQSEAFAQILKRPAWTRALVELLKSGAVPLESVGTIAMDKLRHYPDAAVALLATQTLDALRGPIIKQKDQLIAKLLPDVQKPGDAVHGRQLFASTCAVCHHFNGEGSNLGPDLTGMGAHPRGELLTDIVDPNREVDPSFIAYDFQMKSGEAFQGIIARENARSVLLRDAAGEHELSKGDLAGRRELGRSLMPEGFEALGAENLRDLIAYLQSSDARFRVIDLRQAADADSRQSLFVKTERGAETLRFRRFGDVRVGDIPFVILDPATAASGKNLIVLRGGDSPLAKSYPRKVEIPMGGVEADVLQILGGVGGWAFPCCGDEKGDGMPVVKMTVQYSDRTREELILKNGIEFADYSRPHDVPGSKNASELVEGQQVRVIRKPLSKGGAIDKIILESLETRVAPVFVAITTERSDTRPATPIAGRSGD